MYFIVFGHRQLIPRKMLYRECIVRGTQLSWKTGVVGGHHEILSEEVSCDGIVAYLEMVP